MAGRRYDLSLSLLDRQMIDKDGFAAGKVDDVEFEWVEGSPPYVSAILTGPGALGPRIGGRVGRWLVAIQARLRDPDSPGPATISFGVVTKIDNAVHLNVSREDLPVIRFGAWVRRHLIERIPGARHEAE
jgi:sporulation protein YlmC with PRC-barrel domain